jgi:glycosyltransferase involved in cell wall biosynthesis
VNPVPETFGFAIPCFNEAQNLPALLPLLDQARVRGVSPARFVVVSDASRDGSDEIVEAFATTTSTPVRLIKQNRRLGKALAVNRCIEELRGIDVIVLVSADVLPGTNCIRRLVELLRDPSVGAAGGRVVPFGVRGNPAFEVTRLLWALHHFIMLDFPKCTEITAFRNVVDSIDEASLVDEAELEERLLRKGLLPRYVPEAEILSPSPLRLADYVKRRVYVTLGYLHLRRRHGHYIRTQSTWQRLRAVRRLARGDRIDADAITLAFLLEAAVWSWARLLFVAGRGRNGIWARSESSKRSASAAEMSAFHHGHGIALER